jgi:hypothetical protein
MFVHAQSEATSIYSLHLLFVLTFCRNFAGAYRTSNPLAYIEVQINNPRAEFDYYLV